jgi:hypothetical protein
LPRPGESLFAILTVEVARGARINTADQAFKAIQKGVTQWVKETEEGKKLWKYSSNDMNIGDLAGNEITPELRKYLLAAGIEHLDIEIVQSNDEECSYHYDSIIVNEDELPEEDEQ